MTAVPADFRRHFVAHYLTAIQRPSGIAQRQSSAPRLPRVWARNSTPTICQQCCRSAQTGFRNFFLFDQFQIGLRPEWNTIILAGKVGIVPVGVRPFLQSEQPP
jgi:hypothetical protein